MHSGKVKVHSCWLALSLSVWIHTLINLIVEFCSNSSLTRPTFFLLCHFFLSSISPPPPPSLFINYCPSQGLSRPLTHAHTRMHTHTCTRSNTACQSLLGTYLLSSKDRTNDWSSGSHIQTACMFRSVKN